MISSLQRLWGVCVRYPKSCIGLLHAVLTLAAWWRLTWFFDSFRRMVLENGWDDGGTFFRIAFDGYRALPLTEYRELIGYPFAARVVGLVTGPTPWALVVVSFVSAGLCALVYFSILRSWRLTTGEALAGVAFFLALRTPESVWAVWSQGLPAMEKLVSIEGSEPLFLLLTLLSYREMERERHGWGAVWLAVASLVRIQGVFVAAGAFCYLAVKRRRAAFLYVLSPVALLLHFVFYYWVSGNFFAFRAAHADYYHGGVFTYPYHDLVRWVSGFAPQNVHVADIAFLVLFHLAFVVGFVLLFRRNRLLFSLMIPMYLVAICLRGWSHHMRYYVVLWGINAAWFLAIRDWVRSRSGPITDN